MTGRGLGLSGLGMSSRMAFEPSPLLTHDHLRRRLISSVDEYATLLALRAVNRACRRAVDKLLFAHILVAPAQHDGEPTLRSPVKPHPKLPTLYPPRARAGDDSESVSVSPTQKILMLAFGAPPRRPSTSSPAASTLSRPLSRTLSRQTTNGDKIGGHTNGSSSTTSTPITIPTRSSSHDTLHTHTASDPAPLPSIPTAAAAIKRHLRYVKTLDLLTPLSPSLELVFLACPSVRGTPPSLQHMRGGHLARTYTTYVDISASDPSTTVHAAVRFPHLNPVGRSHTVHVAYDRGSAAPFALASAVWREGVRSVSPAWGRVGELRVVLHPPRVRRREGRVPRRSEGEVLPGAMREMGLLWPLVQVGAAVLAAGGRVTFAGLGVAHAPVLGLVVDEEEGFGVRVRAVLEVGVRECWRRAGVMGGSRFYSDAGSAEAMGRLRIVDLQDGDEWPRYFADGEHRSEHRWR